MSSLGVALFALTLLAGCGGPQEYTGVGRVIAVDAARLHVTIEHEDIPGLMGAMTMRFPVASADALSGIAAGSRVRFVLRSEEGELVVTRLVPLD